MSHKPTPILQPNSSSRRIFDYIVTYKRQHDGNSPSMRQLSEDLGLGYSTVFYQLRHLAEANLIRLSGNQVARGIEVMGGRWTYSPSPVGALPTGEGRGGGQPQSFKARLVVTGPELDVEAEA